MSNIAISGFEPSTKKEYIFPEDFFKIPHPGNPNVMIQFRTKESDESSGQRDNPDIWSNITFNPNNFFDSISLEDEGSAMKLSLSLIDKNHSFLEDKIIKMTQILNIENAKNKEKLKTTNINDPIGNSSLALKTFVSSQASLRIRFGYSIVNNDNTFSTSNFSSFNERVLDMKKPVVMSPWIYFILTDMNVNVTSEGLNVEIEAVNESSPKLHSMKLVGAGYPLRGTAKEIISMMDSFLSLTINGLEVEMKDDPIVAMDETNSETLTVDLGSFVDGEFNFKSISSILDDFCSMIHPIYFDKNGKELIPLSDYEEMENRETTEHKSYPYSWYFYDQGDTPKLVFYYKKAGDNQKKVRSYSWLEHGQSVIKEINLTSEYLFAQLNLPLFNISKTGNHGVYINSIDDAGNTSLKDLSNALKDESFSFTFVQSSHKDVGYNEEGVSKHSGIPKVASINANLNNMLHEGSITIQGDPFFLFDDVVAPFSYLIRLLVKKPTYINEEGERVGGELSYLSGEYIIKKITHEISAGEFTTKLEIQRAI